MSRYKVRRWFAPVLVWSLCQATVLVDRTTVADQFYPSVVSRSDREKQLVAKLNVEVRDLAFYETPLPDFVEAFQDMADVPVAIDTHALEAAGIDPSIPVSIERSGISLRSALHRTLEPLRLTYAIRDEVLLITTPSSPNACEVRCYNVRELLSGDHSSDELVTSLSRILNTSTVSNFGGYGGFEEEYGEQPGGGPTSGRCFATFGNALIVRDTTRGHEQIGRVLATLRDVLRVDRSAPQAESKPDSPSRRPFIRRSDPGSRGSRRTGESPGERGDDPFSESRNRRTSDDPFRDADEPSSSESDDPFGGSGSDDPFGGSGSDDPFGGSDETGKQSSDNPFAQ